MARHEEAGHGARRACFAMRLHQKVAQGSFRHIGPRGDLGEARRGRLQRRRNRLIVGDDVTDRAYPERDLSPFADGFGLLPACRDDAANGEQKAERESRSCHGVLEGRADRVSAAQRRTRCRNPL